MADWLGHLIAGFPSWLFIPSIILIIVGAICYFLFEAMGTNFIIGAENTLSKSKKKEKNRNAKK